MIGRLEDLPLSEQTARLDAIADQMVQIVSDADEPMNTRAVLNSAIKDLSMAQAQAKYGITYAKSTGRLVLDPSTSTLLIRHA